MFVCCPISLKYIECEYLIPVMMRMVDVIWCVDKARWKRPTYRVSLIHPLETNNSQAYKNMIWSKWVIKIRFCLTGASSSIDPTIPPLTSSLCCCNEFLPFPRLPSIPKRGPVTESNKSCTNNTRRQICYQVSEWCLLRCVDVEGEGGREDKWHRTENTEIPVLWPCPI